jgi:hypothetical protein
VRGHFTENIAGQNPHGGALAEGSLARGKQWSVVRG